MQKEWSCKNVWGTLAGDNPFNVNFDTKYLKTQ